jgi:hypothetical protein
MQFINPIEILELENVDIASLDNSVIKKAKRKLFADIDLSDNGHFNYKGLSLTKTDCEKVIDDLANTTNLDFYYHLASNKLLNDFLINGNDKIFTSFQQESIYKLPEFIKFISPFFALKFDKAIIRAFADEDEEKLISILRTQNLISTANLNIAFKGLSIEIQNRLHQIDTITKDIKNEESKYSNEDIEDVINLVKELFPTNLLNILPPYFQSQINKIAASINFLQLANWSEYGNSHVSLCLLEHLLELNIESVSKPTFQKNYDIVKKKHEERLEEEKNAPTLKFWAGSLLKLRDLRDKIEAKKVKPKDVLNEIIIIRIDELNSLPPYANEIRISIAYTFRAISVALWNENKDIDNALKIISKAILINLPPTDKAKLNSDLSKLWNLKEEKDSIGEPLKSAPDLSTTNGIGTTIYGDTLYFVLLHIPIFPIARYNCEETYNGYRFYGKLKLHLWQKIWIWGLIGGIALWIIIAFYNNNNSSAYNYSPTTNYTVPTNTNENPSINSEPISSYNNNTPIESKYKGNQLKDGVSPYDGCFGKGIYSGNATLTIKNGGSSDAIVCLYSIYRDRTIRNEYVRMNSSFTMSNIPQGTYKIRVFYGNDWNPELPNSCGTLGNFETDINFSEFDGTEVFEDSERGYTIATITLYTVVGGNASSSPIDQSTFFKK